MSIATGVRQLKVTDAWGVKKQKVGVAVWTMKGLQIITILGKES